MPVVFPPYPNAQTTRLMENVRSKILGVALPTACAELFSTEVDFCDFTNVWQEDIEVPIVRNITTYQIEPAPISVPIAPNNQTPINGGIIRLLNLYNSTDADKKPVAPATMRVPGVLVLKRPPSEDALWVATVAKVPVDPADVQDIPILEDWIVSQYYDTLEHGVLGRLHLSVAKPYYHKEAGIFHTRAYNNGRAQARVEVLHQNLYGAQNWTFPQSFGVTRPQRGV